MSDTDEQVAYVCEWVGCHPICKEPATGYAGGPTQQHPLCDEHVKPEYHPRGDERRLHPNEPISAPCFHLTDARPTWSQVNE